MNIEYFTRFPLKEQQFPLNFLSRKVQIVFSTRSTMQTTPQRVGEAVRQSDETISTSPRRKNLAGIAVKGTESLEEVPLEKIPLKRGPPFLRVALCQKQAPLQGIEEQSSCLQDLSIDE
jgi:hypothetical protein